MEINRGLLRKRGRESLHGIYWFMLVTCILASIFGASSGVSVTMPVNINSDFNLEVNSPAGDIESAFRQNTMRDAINSLNNYAGFNVIIAAFAAIMIFVLLVGIALNIFVSGPAEVSFAKSKRDAVLNRRCVWKNFLFGFSGSYKNVVKVMFLKNFYIALWLIIPAAVVGALTYFLVLAAGMGVYIYSAIIALAVLCSLPAMVMKYRYMLVAYIVAENPNIKAREALKLSTQMMKGFKWQTFLLGLSFIGWFLLGAFFCGIGILFVMPYYHATETLLYEELKAYHASKNNSGTDELPIETTIVD